MISRFSLKNIEIKLYILHLLHYYLQTHQNIFSSRYFKCDNCSYNSKDFFCNSLNDIVALADILCTNTNKPTIEYQIYIYI